MANVLVTDGNDRSALAVVRSLGAAGHSVFVCSEMERPLAAASIHARDHERVASPLDEAARFVDDVCSLLRRWRISILLPVSDQSALAVLEAQSRFEGVTIPMPSYTSFLAVSDKPRVLEEAAKLGIRIPQQSILPSGRTLDPLDASAKNFDFPLILKPATSVIGNINGRHKIGVSHARNQAELARKLRSLPDEAYPVLLQERINGPGIGVFLLLWEDKLIASFAHRRLREIPPSGGASVDRESIVIDDDLLQKSVALLRAFHWQGVAMVEYKIDNETGEPVLMEINGRFWGSLQLSIDAGVDFPVLLLNAASGLPVPDPPSYRAGIRSRWFWGDVDQLVQRLRHPAEQLNVDDGPSRSQSLREFLLASWQARGEVMRSSDPGPAVRESWRWLQRRGRRLCSKP